jgi:ABC-type transport system involved in cytochrome c biogenesis permease component
VASAHTPRSERRVVRVALLQAVVPVVSFPVVFPVVSFPVVIPAVSFPVVVPVASSHEAGKQARYQCCLVRVVLLQAVVQAIR